MKKQIIVVFLFLMGFQFVVSQDNTVIPDSLTNKSYDYLLERLLPILSNKNLANIYSKSYLNKGKKDRDTLKTLEGFYYLSIINDTSDSQKYTDSAIALSKNVRDYLPSLYLNKGYFYHIDRKYKLAIDNYLIAKKIAEEEGQYLLFPDIDYNLGLVKLRIGAYKQALSTFRENYKYSIKNNLHNNNPYSHMLTLSGLAFAFKYNNQTDSASYYNQLGLTEALKLEDTIAYNKAKVFEGILSYDQGKYKNARDSILKYIPYMEIAKDSINICLSRFYLGKTYQNLGDLPNAILQFKKVDTLIEKSSGYLIEVRENYNILYKHYKSKSNSKLELKYLEKLINFDSILYSNNTYLNNTLFLKYDTPNLIKEKEKLISSLEKKNNTFSNGIYLLSILLLFMAGLAFYFFRKRKISKQRFELLVTQKEKEVVIPKKEKTTVSDNTIKEILKKLDKYELEKGYIDQNTSLEHLAKRLDTNSNYLSRVVNTYKSKNFSSYISDLRIEYAIVEIQKNKILQNYTIKAISAEFGFKNSESFTKAFYKKTGIYPSFYIKELKKGQSK